MRLFYITFFILSMFFIPISDESGKTSVKQSNIDETNIYFHRSDYVSHIVYNRYMLCVYFDNRDILIMVNDPVLHQALVQRGLIRAMIIYVTKMNFLAMIQNICKKNNLALFDKELNLCIVLMTDKINYVLQKITIFKNEVLLFRMINGFSCLVSWIDEKSDSFFIGKMACTINVDKKDFVKLAKWVKGGKNVKRK